MGTTKYGVFSETGHGLADPYIDTVKPDPRCQSLNMKVRQAEKICCLLSRCCCCPVCCGLDWRPAAGAAAANALRDTKSALRCLLSLWELLLL